MKWNGRVAEWSELVLSKHVNILPAIDLMNGEAVRLEQGKANRKTVYSAEPEKMAARWQQEGGDYLHVVDLDAAFSGEQRNLDSVRAICDAITMPCELGGGIRTARAAQNAFEAGISRVIVGSRACQSLDFIGELVTEFGSERIAVGIDAKDGMVATHGWVEVSEWKAVELAKAVIDLGVQTIIYTDIATDGMFTGPNLTAQREMLEQAS
ncbi:MAG: 1-(5-phosphoribosyl)-5-[(5-phosphoribosylamino)methylideneamino] imidazole-4-carboxamide isomerase, partial [Verrucomicrobiota bacterium]